MNPSRLKELPACGALDEVPRTDEARASLARLLQTAVGSKDAVLDAVSDRGELGDRLRTASEPRN